MTWQPKDYNKLGFRPEEQSIAAKPGEQVLRFRLCALGQCAECPGSEEQKVGLKGEQTLTYRCNCTCHLKKRPA